MVSIEWCLKQKNGLEIISLNRNMSESYLKMAEESIAVLPKVSESGIWTATISYYIYYYSLYALMLRIGIKCEIHSCSIEFMKTCLEEFYSKEEVDGFEEAFGARIDLQYYANRPVDKEAVKKASKGCKAFFIKTKSMLSTIREKQIEKIRENLAGKVR
ncbi:hypothetical protein JW711_00215 [Candidatus Woesearchaeota archaeon]|nr:hypothetical protein [Candidatus Woesearchaeota archaeon]